MTFEATLSRYATSREVIDEENLRDRVTVFLTQPEPVEFVEREDNTLYKVRLGDRVDHLAAAFLGDPRLYWVILDFQPEPVLDALDLEPGRVLVIPSFEFVFREIVRK